MKRIVTIQFDANKIRQDLRRQGITQDSETWINGAGWTEVVLSHLELNTGLIDLVFPKCKAPKRRNIKK